LSSGGFGPWPAWRDHRGVVVGAAAGLTFALLVMWIGLGWALFLSVLTVVGGLVGAWWERGGASGDVARMGEWLDHWWIEKGPFR
jgi:uncharacterized membrane protein